MIILNDLFRMLISPVHQIPVGYPLMPNFSPRLVSLVASTAARVPGIYNVNYVIDIFQNQMHYLLR